MSRFKKIVVKVGSNVLTKEDGLLNTISIQQIVNQIAELRKKGVQVILVSSGAVAAGRELMKLDKGIDSISRRQVLASLGQVRLMKMYYQAFEKQKLRCSQVLVTKEDFRDRKHYKNMQNCLSALGDNDVIPIINENDVVSITELMFTDNDELAGMLTSMTASEALVILTNVDGVYDKSPQHSDAKVIATLSCDDSLSINDDKSSFGRGGMKAKLSTAQKVASLGADVFITNGNKENSILSVVENNFAGTHIIPNEEETETVRWVAHSDIHSIPIIKVEDSLSALLLQGNKQDILEKNILEREEDFMKGDVVRIVNSDGDRIGVGMVACDSEDMTSVVVDSDYLYLNID